ncbi:MAG TPA: SDR family oxidoreductase [Flavobacteriales bacterium]|nr:SDR family oxidoreductase [Flavobacteriales bacterium]
MSEKTLSGKTVLITGASSGIGNQVAIECSRQGATVIVTGRNKNRLQATFDQLEGNNHSLITANLTNEDELKKFVEQLPKLNGLVHCAGVLHTYPIKFLNQQKIRETFSANFDMAVMLVAQLSTQKKIEKGASFVFMSSVSGKYPHKGNSLYCASKAALEAFSKTVALEFQHLLLRSNCICPSMIKTPMYDKAEEGMSKELMDEHIAKYPLGLGYPSDIADMAIFLLSEKSRWITGTDITVDGGFMLAK